MSSRNISLNEASHDNAEGSPAAEQTIMADINSIQYRAESFASVGHYDKATEVIGKELASDPENLQLLTLLAYVLLRAGRFTEAESATAAALAVDPDDLTALNYRATVNHERQEYDELLKIAERMLAQDTTHASAHIWLSLGLAGPLKNKKSRFSSAKRKKAEADARAAYARALELDVGSWYFVQASAIEILLGDANRARELVDQGLAEYPMDTQLLWARTEAQTELYSQISSMADAAREMPADPTYRRFLNEIFSWNRSSLLATMWMAPITLVTLNAVLELLFGSVVAAPLFIPVWIFVILKRASYLGTQDRIPQSFQDSRKRAFTWASLIFLLWLVWIVLLQTGAILLMVQNQAGVVLLGTLVGIWALSNYLTSRDDLKNRRSDMYDSDSDDSLARLNSYAVRRTSTAARTALILTALAGAGLAAGALGKLQPLNSAGVSLLCAGVAAVYIIEALRLKRYLVTSTPTGAVQRRGRRKLMLPKPVLWVLLMAAVGVLACGIAILSSVPQPDNSPPIPAPAPFSGDNIPDPQFAPIPIPSLASRP